MGLIKEEMIIQWGIKEGYNIDLLKEYLVYRNKMGFSNKLSIEEYAVGEPNKNINNREFLNWFSTWMSWGFADDIPDTHSFWQYCSKRDLYEYPNKKNYVVYDKDYLAPGYVIFRDDNNQFSKIYTDNTFGFNNYHLIARDISVDEPNQQFRKIIFQAEDGDPLYLLLQSLFDDIQEQHIPTIDKSKQGNNYFKVEKSKRGYNLIIAKDVYGVDKATDFINICIGDNYSCRNWENINNFYNNLQKVSEPNLNDTPINKILKIGPKQ